MKIVVREDIRHKAATFKAGEAEQSCVFQKNSHIASLEGVSWVTGMLFAGGAAFPHTPI